MQILFKTRYDQDIDHWPKRGERWRMVTLIVLCVLAPLYLSDYYLKEMGMVYAYAIAGVGLMLLTGMTGQVSLGHAAFLGIGAYAHTWLLGHGAPFLVAIVGAVVVSGGIGLALGRSASKMHGFYLAIATLAFSVIAETLFGQWKAVTGGYSGVSVPALVLFGWPIKQAWQHYFINLAFAALAILAAANLMRGPTGRAFVAVRDSEVSARSLGVNVPWTKMQAFGLSAAMAGLAGALMAHHLSFLSPEVFGVNESLRMLLMIVVGGLGSILGAVLGAIFISILPNLIGLLKDALPAALGDQPGLVPLCFGTIIVLFILFEPTGLAGRWVKLRHFIETFPYYRRKSFVRQKSYLRTERMR